MFPALGLILTRLMSSAAVRMVGASILRSQAPRTIAGTVGRERVGKMAYEAMQRAPKPQAPQVRQVERVREAATPKRRESLGILSGIRQFFKAQPKVHYRAPERQPEQAAQSPPTLSLETVKWALGIGQKKEASRARWAQRPLPGTAAKPAGGTAATQSYAHLPKPIYLQTTQHFSQQAEQTPEQTPPAAEQPAPPERKPSIPAPGQFRTIRPIPAPLETATQPKVIQVPGPAPKPPEQQNPAPQPLPLPPRPAPVPAALTHRPAPEQAESPPVDISRQQRASDLLARTFVNLGKRLQTVVTSLGGIKQPVAVAAGPAQRSASTVAQPGQPQPTAPRGFSAIGSATTSRLGSSLKTAFHSLTATAQAHSAAQAAGGAPSAPGAGIAGMALTTVKFGSAIGLATGAVIGLLKAAKGFSESVDEDRLKLARFNGAIGVAAAQMQRADIMRERQSAGRLAASTVTLSDAVREMKDSVQPLKDAAGIVVSKFATYLAKLVTVAAEVAKAIPGLSQILQSIDDEAKKQNSKGGPWQQSLLDLAKRYSGPQPGRRMPPIGGRP